MGFFATFWTWLNGQLAMYIGDNTARLAAVLEPVVVSLATIYVMAWGYLQLTGRLDEPLVAGLKRIAMLALVLGVGLHLWLYNSVLVDTFYTAPAQLAAALVGSSDPVGTIDTIWESGGAVAGTLWTKGAGTFSVAFVIAGTVVWLFIGTLCVYAMFLIALSSIALAVLLALGPIFVTLCLFEPTRRFFAAWIAQLTNYALITVLTVLVAALLLQIVQSYATQTAARGSTLQTVDALHMILISALVFLVMRQVMPIAAGLAGGSTLHSFSTISRSVGRSVGWTLRAGGALGKPVAAFGLPQAARTLRVFSGRATAVVVGAAAGAGGHAAGGAPSGHDPASRDAPESPD
jgi:type IV secretion system protein VirB6